MIRPIETLEGSVFFAFRIRYPDLTTLAEDSGNFCQRLWEHKPSPLQRFYWNDILLFSSQHWFAQHWGWPLWMSSSLLPSKDSLLFSCLQLCSCGSSLGIQKSQNGQLWFALFPPVLDRVMWLRRAICLMSSCSVCFSPRAVQHL